MPQWFAERGVEVICSLPHYRKLGTDAQRGKGAYDKSLRALRMLNEAGYGHGDPTMPFSISHSRYRDIGMLLSASSRSK